MISNSLENSRLQTLGIDPNNYGPQTFHCVERSVLSNRMVSSTPDGMVSEKCHRQMIENTERKNYMSAISATRFPTDFYSSNYQKEKCILPSLELSPRQAEAISRIHPNRKYSECSLTSSSDFSGTNNLPENIKYGRYPEFTGPIIENKKTSVNTPIPPPRSPVVSCPTTSISKNDNKNIMNDGFFINNMTQLSPIYNSPSIITMHESQPNATMETTVSGPTQKRVGRWTLAQLRQTDGIIPSQAGWNKGDSQKLMTNFGTPRNTQLNVKAECLTEIPEEIRLLSNADVRLQSGTNKYCSQRGMTGFGSGRDVCRESVRVNTNPADLPELSEEKIRASEGIVRLQAGTNQYDSQKGMTMFGTSRRETCKMVDSKHPEYDHTRPDQSEIPLQAGTNKFASQKGMTQFGTTRRETAKIVDERHPEYDPETSIDQTTISYQMGSNLYASQKGMTSFGQGRWEVLDPSISWQNRKSQGMVRLQSGTNRFASQAGMTKFGTPRNNTFEAEGGELPYEDMKKSETIIPSQAGWNKGDSQRGYTSFGAPRDVRGKHLKRIWELEYPEEAEISLDKL
uniref:OV9m n=1 Tax=Parastrongyloides trichosuri TaxID=131310 RepID=A0A0N4ZN20_PARTI